MDRVLQRRLPPSRNARRRSVREVVARQEDAAATESEEGDSGMNMLPPEPITITVTRVVQPTPTTSVLSSEQSPSHSVPGTLETGIPPHTMSTSTTISYTHSASTPISSESSSQSSQLSSPSTSPALVGTDAAENGGSNSNQGIEPVSGTSAPKKIPSGVLIGVIIAAIVLTFAIAIFSIRRRYVRRRQRLRKGWANSKASHLSVLPEPKGHFSSSPSQNHAQQVPMLVQTTPKQSTLTLAMPEAMPLAPPASYGNDASSPASATMVSPSASTPSPVYGPPAAKALFQPITTVVSTFITTLPDELSISVGESVRVLAEYDDGWALCVNTRGEQGMIPMECLDGQFSMTAESISGNREAGGNLRRVSSLRPSVGSLGRF